MKLRMCRVAFFEDFSETIISRRGKEYLERCKEGDQSARDMLIEHNMRLVAHVVKSIRALITTWRTCCPWEP